VSAPRKRYHPVRHRLEYGLFLIFIGFCRLLPESWVPAAGAVLGGAAFYLIPRRRRITLENLRNAFRSGGPDPRDTARASYGVFATSLVEFLRASAWDRKTLLGKVCFEGFDRVEEALREGQGLIMLASHFGNWELMGLAHSALEYPSHVVGRPLDNPWLNRWMNRQRERFGSTVINSKDPSSLRQILSALHHRKTVAFLIDQNVVGDRGVYVDFFGRLAYTHKVVALVAIKTGAPVIPAFIRREKDGRHRLVYGAALPLIKTGHRERDVWANTQEMTRAIENAVRQSPEQWLWMHDRWKKQPRVGTRAVFVDRDGTITEEVGYIRDIDHLKLLPNSAEAIRKLNRSGIKAIVVTNQSGVARGYYSEDHVRRVNDRLSALLKAEGAVLDGIYYCPHHPTEGNGPYTQACRCRKPGPGMLDQAASELRIGLDRSFVVGDKLTDMEMAHRVGAKGLLVLTGYGEGESTRRGETGTEPDRIVSDLGEAVEWILSQIHESGRA
jgi:D-glycero-D-manno-heptose 1,7-bisphosphate phosphatase